MVEQRLRGGQQRSERLAGLVKNEKGDNEELTETRKWLTPGCN